MRAPAVGFPSFIRYIFATMTRAAVALLQQDRRVLVCQRKRNSRYGLTWEFPGGKLEPGESVEDCLRRELREELSIEIDSIGPTQSQHNRFADGGEFDVTYCFVPHFTGTPVNRVFEEIRWVTLDELRSLDILEGNKSLVSALDERMFL
jgi:8-oxo-dGTP diphosphatase